MLWLCDHEEARTMDLTKNKQLAVSATVCPSGHNSHVPPFFPNIEHIQKNPKKMQSTNSKSVGHCFIVIFLYSNLRWFVWSCELCAKKTSSFSPPYTSPSVVEQK